MSVQWLSILFLHALDMLLPEQVKPVQRFARIAGIFLCLFYSMNIARTCDVFLSLATYSATIRLYSHNLGGHANGCFIQQTLEIVDRQKDE